MKRFSEADGRFFGCFSIAIIATKCHKRRISLKPFFHDHLSSFGVMDIGCMHINRQQQTKSIHQNMTFPSLDLFMTVIGPFFARA
jgi:hypothetical protein